MVMLQRRSPAARRCFDVSCFTAFRQPRLMRGQQRALRFASRRRHVFGFTASSGLPKAAERRRAA